MYPLKLPNARLKYLKNSVFTINSQVKNHTFDRRQLLKGELVRSHDTVVAPKPAFTFRNNKFCSRVGCQIGNDWDYHFL